MDNRVLLLLLGLTEALGFLQALGNDSCKGFLA